MKEIDPRKLARFEKWCRSRYASSSSKKFVADVRTLVKYQGEPPHSQKRIARLRDYKLVWTIWEEWGEGGSLGLPCPVVPDQKKGGRRNREPKRIHEAVSFDRDDYKALVSSAEAMGTPPAIVFVIIARTGLRICDVLRTPLGLLRNAMKRSDGIVTITVKGSKSTVYSIRGGGGVERAWKALLEHEDIRRAPANWHVAAAVMNDPDAPAEAGFGAYERVRVVLKKLGAKLDVSGRVHLHRSRRSVGVYLAASGATLEQIGKVLVHSGQKTTASYVDEARAVESTKLLQRLED